MGQEFIKGHVLEFGLDVVVGIDQEEMVAGLLNGKIQLLLGNEDVVIGN